MKGRVKTETTLITAVSETDSAVSPRARWVSRLEVTPPGQAARIMTPTASTGSIGQRWIRPKATSGSSTIWLTAPTRKSLGCTATRLKSATFSANPRLNMMKASEIGRKTWVTMFPSGTALPLLSSCRLLLARRSRAGSRPAARDQTPLRARKQPPSPPPSRPADPKMPTRAGPSPAA